MRGASVVDGLPPDRRAPSAEQRERGQRVLEGVALARHLGPLMKRLKSGAWNELDRLAAQIVDKALGAPKLVVPDASGALVLVDDEELVSRLKTARQALERPYVGRSKAHFVRLVECARANDWSPARLRVAAITLSPEFQALSVARFTALMREAKPGANKALAATLAAEAGAFGGKPMNTKTDAGRKAREQLKATLKKAESRKR